MPSFDGWSAQIRILHISDLHERGSREKEAWRRQSVLGDEFMQNLAQLSAEGPIDLVLFTGDLANFGLADEYEAATSFVDDVLKTVNLPRERFFSVPGNHDISREVNKAVWAEFRERAGSVDQTELSRWLAGLGKPPLGIDGTWRELLLERQKPYRHWVNNTLGRPDMDPTDSPHGFLGYRSTIAMEGIPFNVHVVGLDTAWLAGDDADAGKLRLTDGQIGQLTHDINGRKLLGLRIGLHHHPLTDLADASLSKQKLADGLDLLFRGHVHEPQVEAIIDPDRALRSLAAGCLYDGAKLDRYRNACQVATLTVSPEGKLRQVEIRFRSWSPNGFWHDDDSLYRGSQRGRVTWPIAGNTPTARLQVPLDLRPSSSGATEWRCSLAPGCVSECWGDPVIGSALAPLEVGCLLARAENVPLAQALFRLALHGGVRSLYVNNPDSWNASYQSGLDCIGAAVGGVNWKWAIGDDATSKWRIASLSAYRGWPVGQSPNVVQEQSNVLANQMHTSMDLWVWIRLKTLAREVLQDGNLDHLGGLAIAPSIRTRMWAIWQSWLEGVEPSFELRRHFMQAMLTTADPVDSDAAYLRLGPLTVVPCLLNGLIFALAVEAGLSPSSKPHHADMPVNLTFLKEFAHIVGLQLNGGRKMHINLPNFEREPAYLLLAHCSTPGPDLENARQRIGSGAENIIRIAAPDLLHPKTFTGTLEFELCLSQGMDALASYLQRLLALYKEREQERLTKTIGPE